MFITKKADYAVRCVLYLANNQEGLATIGEISNAMHVPESFLAKILQQLIKTGIVVSERGIKGGFSLARNPEEISLLEVIEIMQGPAALNSCAVDGKNCELSKRCTVHPIWIKLRKSVEQELRKHNFKKLTAR